MDVARAALGRSADRGGLLPFLEAHVHPRPRVKWSLERHEYLRGIVTDPAKIIVARKAAQVGISTLMVGEMLHACRAGMKAGYFLDTQGRMRSFVQDRVDTIINADDELVRQVTEVEWEPQRPRRRGKGADNVRLKHINPGSAYFLSTGAMGEVKTVDLDVIYMDEVAELDQEIAAFAQDRLLHSEHKYQRWFSQPSVPEMDIDEWFQRSDQKHWQLQCRRCRAWTALELVFPECLIRVKGEWRIACPRCRARLHREDGEWIARHPGREISGYHFSQLYGPHITAAEIAAQWERAQANPWEMRRFMISVVGVPYAGELQPITDELLKTRCGEWGISATGKADIPSGLTFAGIDQGDLLHLVIGNLSDDVLRTVWLESTPSWEAVEKRLKDHGVSMFIVDAMPYKNDAKRLVRSLGTGAILYSSAKRTTYSIEDKETEPVHAINVDRTEYLDRVSHALSAGALWLPKPYLPETMIAKAHLKKLIRQRQEDGSYRYRRKVENHYGMAFANMILAVQGQQALHLAPAGHFEPTMRDQQSGHIVGRTFAPRRW